VISEVADAVDPRGGVGRDGPRHLDHGGGGHAEVERVLGAGVPAELGGPVAVVVHHLEDRLAHVLQRALLLDREEGALHALVVARVGGLEGDADGVAGVVRGLHVRAVNDCAEAGALRRAVEAVLRHQLQLDVVQVHRLWAHIGLLVGCQVSRQASVLLDVACRFTQTHTYSHDNDAVLHTQDRHVPSRVWGP
jgi:hypothetical protein